MQFQAALDASACATLVSSGESLVVKATSLQPALARRSPEVVGLCKEVVGLTRTVDSTLDALASQAAGADAEGLTAAKNNVKKSVHSLLKTVKDVQSGGGGEISASQSTELDDMLALLRRSLIKARSIIEERRPVSGLAAAAGPTSTDSPASQRFALLQKQVAAKEAAKRSASTPPVVAPLVVERTSESSKTVESKAAESKASDPKMHLSLKDSQHALGMSQAVVLDDEHADDEEAQVATTPQKKFGMAPSVSPRGSPSPGLGRIHAKSNPNVLRNAPLMGSKHLLPAGAELSMSLARLGPLTEDRSTKLLAQFDAKCRWLEDELYRSNEVHVVLRILQAQNLSPLDPNGKSDPYCVVPNMKTSSGGEVRTKTIAETLDPVWDESFEFRLSSRMWAFRIELLDYDSDTKSKPLGFVDMRATDWSISTRERKKWLPVQGGSGTLYVGIKLAQHLGLARVEGEKYHCQCCDKCDIPDVYACEKCGKQTCALCIGLFLCDSCREDLCKRAKKSGSAEQELVVSPAVAGAQPEPEVVAAKLSATLVDVADWHEERYNWQPWSAALGDKAADPTLLVVPKNYGVEHGSVSNAPLTKGPIDLTMLDPFETYPHYTQHMVKTDHAIFVGSVTESATPIMLVVQKLSYNASNEQKLLSLVYSPDGTARQILLVEGSDISNAGQTKKSKGSSSQNMFNAASGQDLRAFLLEKFAGLSLQRVPVAAHSDVASKLLEYERNHTDIRRRVGVLFLPKGVREENQVFKSTGSPDLYEFMDMLAERVRLQGWPKYAGGLNTQNNSTGLESYYTEFLGFNIMFHVNSLLEDDGSEQQLSRKRFIGNDLVVFIFVEGDEPFDASMITSQMCHTFIVVKKIASKPTRYRVSVVAKPGVPAFSPFLPFPNEFEKSDKLRQLLLAKALNGNRATFQAKTFLQKTKRTRKDLLARMQKDLADDGVLTNSPPIVFDPQNEPSPLLLCADNVPLKATADFIAEDATFLSLRTGDIVTAVTANPTDVYWTGILNGRVGRFPSDKVELATTKQRGIGALLKEKSSKSVTSSPATSGSVASVGNVIYRIRFYQGRNMSVCDPWGTSDPYCTISSVKDVYGKPIRTKVHQRTLNPEWNQAFEFVNTAPFTLRVEIWDKDLVGTDDSMGFVDLLSKDWNLSEMGVEEVRWLEVVDGDGDIQLGLTKVQTK